MVCSYPFLGVLPLCFGSLSFWRTHDLKLKPSFLTGQYILLQNALLVLWFYCTLHRFNCASCIKAAPEHIRGSSLFHSMYSTVFFSLLIFTSVNKADVTCQNILVLSHLSKGQIPVSFLWLLLTKKSSITSTLTVMDGASWRWYTLTLAFTSNLFGSCSGLFGYYPSLQFVINFPVSGMSREVGYSSVDFKLLNKICNCGHRYIKLLGDSRIAFTFNMFVYAFLSNFPNQLLSILWSMLVFNDTKQHTFRSGLLGCQTIRLLVLLYVEDNS